MLIMLLSINILEAHEIQTATFSVASCPCPSGFLLLVVGVLGDADARSSANR